MADILHRIGIRNATPQRVYDALTSVDGLAGWWTDDTRGSSELGGVLEFRFSPGGWQDGGGLPGQVVHQPGGGEDLVDQVHRVMTRFADGPYTSRLTGKSGVR